MRAVRMRLLCKMFHNMIAVYAMLINLRMISVLLLACELAHVGAQARIEARARAATTRDTRSLWSSTLRARDSRASLPTSFPGSSLYLEKVPWLRLATCLLDFSRFQGCDWREGLESQSLSSLSSPTESSREWNCKSAKLTAKAFSHSLYWSSVHSMLG